MPLIVMTVTCSRPEDGLRCRLGVKPPLNSKLTRRGLCPQAGSPCPSWTLWVDQCAVMLLCLPQYGQSKYPLLRRPVAINPHLHAHILKNKTVLLHHFGQTTFGPKSPGPSPQSLGWQHVKFLIGGGHQAVT